MRARIALLPYGHDKHMNTIRKKGLPALKKTLLSLAALMLALLYACGGGDESGGTDKSKTITTSDGSVSIDVPEGWSEDTTISPENYHVLAVGDGAGAFAQVFYYPDDGSGYIAKDYADMTAEEYYGENVIGEVQETQLDDHEAHYFEYSMVDEGVDGNEYNYHGYEYFIGFGRDVVEVDIFYSQGKLEGKLFTPSDEQLALLRNIAETVRVKE